MNFLKSKASQFFLEKNNSGPPDEGEASGIFWKNRTNLVCYFHPTNLKQLRIIDNRLELHALQLRLQLE